MSAFKFQFGKLRIWFIHVGPTLTPFYHTEIEVYIHFQT